MIPFYQSLSRLIFKIVFSRSCWPSQSTKHIFWKFYFPADRLWLLKTVGRVLGYATDIPHRKYQVKTHSSPWFSAPCAAAIVHRNHFFFWYQQNKSSESTLKFRQASNYCRRVLEAAKLAYAHKTKQSIPRHLPLVAFGELLVVFLTKVNLL